MIHDNNVLLLQAVGLLKDGGVLVYSTCTITPQENEEQVAWALKSFPCLKLARHVSEICLFGNDNKVWLGKDQRSKTMHNLKARKKLNSSFPAPKDSPRDSTRKISQWWHVLFLVGEHNVQDASVVALPHWLWVLSRRAERKYRLARIHTAKIMSEIKFPSGQI